MKNVFNILCIAALSIQAKNATAQEKFDISVSTDETNVLYVGLINTIQFNVNYIPSEKLFVLFTDEEDKVLDSNVFSINRISPNTYTLHMSRRWGNTVIAHLYKSGADSSIPMGKKRFKIRNVARPVTEISLLPLQKHWDYLMNSPTLNVTMLGMLRKDIQYTITGYDFTVISKDGPRKVIATGNSLAPAKQLLQRVEINNFDSVFYMFSNIKAIGPSGTVYLENISSILTHGKPAYQSLENFYGKKMEQYFDLNKALQNKLLQISLKIHNAAIAGKIQPYWDQTLRKKCTPDSYAMNGSKLILTQIPLNNDPEDLIDTLFSIPLKESSMTADLGFCFKLSDQKKGSVRKDIQSIAPMYFERFLNGLSYNIPTGWFSYKNINSVLSAEDMKFLEAYSWYKNLEPLYVEYSNDAFQVRLEDFEENKTITHTYNGIGVTENLGNNLQENWRSQLYKAFKENKFSLTMGFDKPIAETEFNKLHTIQEYVFVQDTAYPDDFEKLIEVYYNKIPTSFDSIYFVFNRDMHFMKIAQKNNEDIKFTYSVNLQNVKSSMNPHAFCLLEILLNESRQKLQKFSPK